MAKADLLRECKKLGIPVSGNETVAELEELLGKAGETQAQMDEEAAVPEEPVPAETTEQEAKVAEAKAKLDEAKAKLAEAQAEFNTAADEHAAASKPVAVYGKHILLETGAHGEYSLADAPPGWENDKPYRLLLNGQNYEHTSTVDATGVWIYRRIA
jgi:hypothetical protein